MAAERLAGPSMLALLADLDGPAIWRVLWPFTALQKRGYPCGWDRKDNPLVAILAPGFNGFVLPRLAWRPEAHRVAESWFRQLRSAGRLVVYDLDDDIVTSAVTRHLLDSGLANGQIYQELEARRLETIWAMQQCDGVTVSTQRLATIVSSYTPRPVVVVPNAIDLPWFRRVVRATKRQTTGLTIGWIGGKRADADVEIMAVAWGRIAKRYPDVTFVVAGHWPPVIGFHVDRARVVRLPWQPLDRYPSALAEVDIACCPVAVTRFNRAKSAIKAIEAGAAGCAVVASPLLYDKVVDDGVSGYLAETVDDWERALAQLVESASRRRMLARRLTRHVERKHALSENLWRWPDAWATIAESARERRGRLVTV